MTAVKFDSLAHIVGFALAQSDVARSRYVRE